MRYCLVIALAAATCLPLQATELPGGGIQADNVAAHLRTLASDAFEGRAPATAGEDRTVAYLVEQFRKAGLQPAGEDGGWTQAVQLDRTTIDGDVVMSVSNGSGKRALKQGEDAVVQTLRPGKRVHLENAALVFVGYGIVAPELGWNDYAGVDLAGKVAVVLVNDPDFETPQPGLFGGRALTYYGRWTYKYEEAARQGASGVLLVHETAPASYGWTTVRNSGVSPQFDIVRPDAERAHVPVRGWIQRDLAMSLFKDAGLDLEAEKTRAQRKGFKAVTLKGTTLSVDFATQRDRITSRNVLGVLPGSKRADETVIVSGHWDGYGIGTPDASGDRIYNAAVDNATAIASMIELARVFNAGKPLQRSLLFLATTSEEKNLLGAKYYAAHPLRPLATTAAVLNMEMWSPDGPARDIASWGDGKVSLQQDLAKAAAVDGRAYSPDPDLSVGLFYRADHFAFAQAGVPGITIGPGMDQFDGGKAGGDAARADYFAKRYHQPDDEFSAAWDMRGPVADITTVYHLIRGLADSEAWPTWNADSEFHAEREKSAVARGR
ncbi:MAG: M28 family peptidase [Luteimonas sp.]|nr:M28 family peptidase [Luteimonas sp.]